MTARLRLRFALVLLERDWELSEIERVIAVARDGRGGVVVLSGEAGIGKSSLIEDALAESSDIRVLAGRCDDLFAARPFGPVRDLVAGAASSLADACRSGDVASVAEAMLRELARSGPLPVLVFDDMQWVDTATLDVVRIVGRRIRRLRAVMLIAHREIAPNHHLRMALGEIAPSDVTRLPLSPLSADAVRLLVASRRIDIDELMRSTGGNPFFVVEVLAADESGVPVSVREAVLARAGRLGESSRAALELVAVVGAPMEVGLLRDLCGEECDTVIDDLVAHGMLRAVATRWEFRHDIVRQAILSTIGEQRLLGLHRQVLDALRDDDLARRAHHAAAAGDRAAVLAIAASAAADASRSGAHLEAAMLIDLELDAIGPDPGEERANALRRAITAHALADRLDRSATLAAELATWHEQIRDVPSLVTTLSELAQYERLVGRPDAMAHIERAHRLAVAGSDSRSVAKTLAALAWQHMVSGTLHEAIRFGGEALEVAGQVGDLAVRVHVLNTVGVARISIGDERGWGEIEESLRTALEHGWTTDAARAYSNLFWCAIENRRHELATRWYDEAIDFVEMADRFMFNCMSADLALLRLQQGRWSEARERALATLRVSAASDVHRVWVLVTVGLLRARYGDPDPASPLLEAMAIARKIDEVQLIQPVLAAQVEVAWLAGDHEVLEAGADRLWSASAHDPHRWRKGTGAFWHRRVHGDVGEIELDELPPPHRAYVVGDHVLAAEEWTTIGSTYEAADALADSDDPADVLRAIEMLGRMGARPRIEIAHRHLRRLGLSGIPRGPRASTAKNPGGLTARQLEVLELLDDGIDNAGIAARLFIAPKTVDHHVSAVLAKLDVRHRREAGAAARVLGWRPKIRESRNEHHGSVVAFDHEI